MNKEGGIYVHIPFCRHKCLYCDFYTGGVRVADWDEYLKSIVLELSARINELDFNPVTIYIGGGTPSLIPGDKFLKFIREINEVLGFPSWKEFTLEVNPEDVSFEMIKSWQKAGVTRVSMGVQSLQDDELKIIGRTHDARMAKDATEMLKSNFDNISLDVMFGIPRQTFSSYKESLGKIVGLQPSHISSYSLMLEDGTAMTHLVKQEKIELPDENDWLKMFDYTSQFLKESGYDRYEVSNFSLPGKESLHNSSYWEGKPYIGLGPGAHSYDGGKKRRANCNDIKGYIRKVINPGFCVEDISQKEILGETELREELVMTRLRMVKGLDINEFSKRFGRYHTEELMRKIHGFINEGLMKKEAQRVFITDSGFPLFDSILSSLI